MRMRRYVPGAVLVLVLGLACLFGCDESVFIGDPALNEPPTVRLTGGPPEGDTTSYRIKFSWMGNDPDGSVKRYEYAMCDGNPGGFDPADTTGLDAWTKIHCTDSTFSFSASENGEEVNIGASKISTFCRSVHTFFIRAVDDKGMRSRAAYRSFTASTLAPYAVIESPRNAFPGREQQLPSLVRFQWKGEDPIDDPWNVQEPESIRHFLAPYTLSIIENLNKLPEDFESRWVSMDPVSRPRGFRNLDHSRRRRNHRDRVRIRIRRAGQGRSGCRDVRVRSGPEREDIQGVQPSGAAALGHRSGTSARMLPRRKNRMVTFRIPADFMLDFSWTADASSYGAVVSSYRYGWDVADLSDPNEWDVFPSPLIKAAPLIAFRTGVHTLFVEATDNLGTTTLAQFEVTVFPAKMTRESALDRRFLLDQFSPDRLWLSDGSGARRVLAEHLRQGDRDSIRASTCTKRQA